MVVGALVDVHLAMNAVKSESAITVVASAHVCTRGIVMAWRFGAVVFEVLAVDTLVAVGALAGVSVRLVVAFCVVLARGGGTLVDVFVAVGTGPSRLAEALAGVELVDA